jgi:hypothetical protein
VIWLGVGVAVLMIGYLVFRQFASTEQAAFDYRPSDDSLLETELELERLENRFRQDWAEGEIKRESDRALSELKNMMRRDNRGLDA